MAAATDTNLIVVLSDEDHQRLLAARHLLEHPGLAARITNWLGSPIEKGLERLPKSWHERLGKITRAALTKSADAALFTMRNKPGAHASNRLHKLGVAVSGGVGGFFGLEALAVELPVSTSLMLRSVADIARSEGESIDDPETKLACLEVFALGGRSTDDDGSESGYYAVRAALAKSVSEAAQYVATHQAIDRTAPVLVRFIAQVADRFGVQITEKAAAQAVPAIGAAGGAIINTLFIDHFQEMARGHFIIRGLERKYGAAAVRLAYAKLADEA